MMKNNSVHKATDSEHVPILTCIGWGFGGLADNFMFNTMAALGTLAYVYWSRRITRGWVAFSCRFSRLFSKSWGWCILGDGRGVSNRVDFGDDPCILLQRGSRV